MHANPKLIVLLHWCCFLKFYFLQTQLELRDMRYSGFIASSADVHKIMEYADAVSKLLGWNFLTLLAMLEKFSNDYWNYSRDSDCYAITDWLKNLAPFFNQWEAKLIAPWTCDVFRAFSKLLVTRNSDCFIALFAPVVIGKSNYFGVGFSTVIWKPLHNSICFMWMRALPNQKLPQVMEIDFHTFLTYWLFLGACT